MCLGFHVGSLSFGTRLAWNILVLFTILVDLLALRSALSVSSSNCIFFYFVQYPLPAASCKRCVNASYVISTATRNAIFPLALLLFKDRTLPSLTVTSMRCEFNIRLFFLSYVFKCFTLL